MAILPNPDRFDLWAAMMREASDARAPLPLTKAQLRAAVDAADSWADSAASAYNTALPLPARTALTPKQKARILGYVIMRRHEVTA